MTVPVPSLRYSIANRESYTYGGTNRLFSVREVTAHAWPDGLSVWAEGPMMKKDGTLGRHCRGSRVDLTADQPEWMAAIITDARERLAGDLP